jgi:hypothetical protein
MSHRQTNKQTNKQSLDLLIFCCTFFSVLIHNYKITMTTINIGVFDVFFSLLVSRAL